jgi:hypothetical protein
MNPNNHSDIYNAFNTNKSTINMRNFRNTNDILYNNVADNILDQNIHEVTIRVDTADRDYKLYPNPYNFKITFNPSLDTTNNKNNRYGNQNQNKSDIRWKGSSGPVIYKEFSNVKYIKLDTLFIPKKKLFKTHNIENDDVLNNIEWRYLINKNITFSRFLILDIPEFFNDSVYGTNEKIGNSFGLISTSTNGDCDCYQGYTYDCFKSFPATQLGNIKTLTIKILDSIGEQLEMPNLDTSVNTPKYCICDDYNYTIEQKKFCVCSYKRHPLNPRLQMFMIFKIGVVANTINNVPLRN